MAEQKRAKNGILYEKTGADEWAPVTKKAKDGTVYESSGLDEWTPINAVAAGAEMKQPSERVTDSGFEQTMNLMDRERQAPAYAIQKLLEKYAGAPTIKFPLPQEISKSVPTTQEMLKNANLDTGIGLLDMGIGIGGDILTSPSTYASLGGTAALKQFPKIAKAVDSLKWANPIAEATGGLLRTGGNAVYRNAFSKLDAAAEKAGKKIMPSKILMDNNIAAPTARGVEEKIKNLGAQLLQERDAILKQGAQTGKNFDVNAMFADYEKRIDELIKNPDEKIRAMGENLKANLIETKENFTGRPPTFTAGTPPVTTQTPTGLFDQYGKPVMKTQVTAGTPPKMISAGKQRTVVNPWSLQGMKEEVGQNISRGAFSDADTLTKEMDSMKYQAYKKEVENLSKDPSKIENLNQQMSSLITSEKPEMTQYLAEEARDLFSPINTAIGMVSPKVAAVKMLTDVTGRQGPQSMIGRTMRDVGAQKTLIRALTNPIKTPANPNPWDMLEY